MNALIVEDNRSEAHFAASFLEGNGIRCRCAANGEAGLAELSANQFDIAIVDVVLGSGMSGFELIKAMRERKISTPVIVLSGKAFASDKIEGLNCGADDYVAKPFSRDELLARINAVLRRSSGVKSNRTLRVKDLSICPDTREVRRGKTPIRLTTGEYGLLKFLMTNAGRTLPTKMILQSVWNVDTLPPSKIVESRICSLRRKLSPNGEPNMIFTTRGFGYVLR